ncbi:ribulokinase [Holotrichia oblita]|uniref:Ribulokinase n=1 Tax=Holotrichia oblita TaxID=644536 RepID=A0ACB9T687_HOLOL|nr:ribulokinase [Holotrichia oblita]
MAYFVGVDVGTGSTRAALISAEGKVVNICVKNIKTWNPQNHFYEQSSEDIWSACVYCIQTVIENVEKNNIKGIGFGATCSLVVLDKKGQPLSVSPSENNAQNVILWLDHRAVKEAAKINELNNSVLKYVGGKISLEMETPKLLWLKNNLYKKCWINAGYFFDLPDFLTWKATGDDSRSLCSLVCKWTYEIDGWNEGYFREIGLEDLIEDNFKKIGSKVQIPGTPIGRGLSEEAAGVLGLLPGTPVGTSIIDAHAGGLGLIGCSIEGISNDFNTKLSLICGTSTCHMAVSKEPIFTEGIWGPYFSAMVPGMWLNEGGQSATGKLIDHIIETHPVTPEIKKKIGDKHIQAYLGELLEEMRKKQNLKSISLLTADLHIWPDFHGNRSPLADPSLRGMISGLSLSSDEENLALLYLGTLQALSYGTKHIVETLLKYGYKSIESVLICGGLSKNHLFIQTQADVLNIPVIVPNEKESVLLGAGILGACAAGYFKDIEAAIRSMGGSGKVVYPDQDIQDYHSRKYRVFLKMVADQNEYKQIMNC